MSSKMHLDRRVPVFPDGAPIIDPSHACSFNPIGLGCLMKMGKNGLAALFVKVINFPVAKTSKYASESMYVMLNQSVVPLKENFTEDEAKKWCRMYLASGEGILVNFPTDCEIVEYGDLVCFGHGSFGKKAQFTGKKTTNKV